MVGTCEVKCMVKCGGQCPKLMYSFVRLSGAHDVKLWRVCPRVPQCTPNVFIAEYAGEKTHQAHNVETCASDSGT